ncbi:LOW QUALITY PROTEIN: hypothetical protein PHMEG_00017522 [Phytophthora megakarya]|uniref:Uncharacterized protein n=1 Tax=Phytophthora megakarya TaxID=4795 RepID=A0A225VYS1_9STRA|nr:LOW QUALITY PROTEIN: hypothetical protein PHMEG_00017522 [Phytophthora megakarya]
MGGESDIEGTPDPDHPLLDEPSPVPTPEPRYLSYDKDGSKKSDVPASLDPASKSKSKPRSTGDPMPSKDADLEAEDQESEANTSADGEDDDTLNDMLQAQTLMALSRSGSEQRRRDHAAPHRLKEMEILDQVVIQMVMARATAVVVGGGSPVDPASMPLVSMMLPRRHFTPDHVCIPDRQQTRQYDIADVDPWMIQRINTLTIITMTLEYCSHLITGQNVGDLMAALPWNVLTGANIPEPMSFEITVDGRLGFLIKKYSAVEFQDLIAYWESTHRFAVSPALIHSDPYLAFFVVEKKNRRSHADARWKQILRLFLITMHEGCANLADPQLHRREPADLIEALAECDATGPWRTHYRLHHAGHPARRITRLTGKFFNVAALNPNVPLLPRQP